MNGAIPSKSEKRIPKHGDEDHFNQVLSLTLLTVYSEKRIPKHGDEEKTCVILIVGETDYP